MRLNIADFKGFKASLLSAIADIAAFIRRADKTCFQIDLSSLKDKTDNILLCG